MGMAEVAAEQTCARTSRKSQKRASSPGARALAPPFFRAFQLALHIGFAWQLGLEAPSAIPHAISVHGGCAHLDLLVVRKRSADIPSVSLEALTRVQCAEPRASLHLHHRSPLHFRLPTVEHERPITRPPRGRAKYVPGSRAQRPSPLPPGQLPGSGPQIRSESSTAQAPMPRGSSTRG